MNFLWASCAIIYLLDLLSSFSWSIFLDPPLTTQQILAVLEATFILMFWDQGSRRILWLISLIIAVLGFGIPMYFFLALLFYPKWLGSSNRAGTILYDGECGLCHRWVKFSLSEDYRARRFKLAPLQEASRLSLLSGQNNNLTMDSIVVISDSGERLIRSEAALYILSSLGGYWRAFSTAGGIIPSTLRDFCYNLIAKYRYLFFGKESVLCPIIPSDLKDRFLHL